MEGLANGLGWSEEKQRRLQACLTGMWAEDLWQVKSINEKGDHVQRTLCFPDVNASLKNEFKYAVWYQWNQGTWQRYHKRGQREVLYSLRYLGLWLQALEWKEHSFLEHSLEFWECSLRSWLVQTEQYTPRSSKRLMAATHTYKKYFTEDRRIYVFRTIYHTLMEAYDDRKPMEKDIWDLQTDAECRSIYRNLGTFSILLLSNNPGFARWRNTTWSTICLCTVPAIRRGN